MATRPAKPGESETTVHDYPDDPAGGYEQKTDKDAEGTDGAHRIPEDPPGTGA